MIFSRSKELRIRLEEPELRTLLRGGELALESKVNEMTVKMILADIGFDQIQRCLNDAVDGVDHYKPHITSIDV